MRDFSHTKSIQFKDMADSDAGVKNGPTTEEANQFDQSVKRAKKIAARRSKGSDATGTSRRHSRQRERSHDIPGCADGRVEWIKERSLSGFLITVGGRSDDDKIYR